MKISLRRGLVPASGKINFLVWLRVKANKRLLSEDRVNITDVQIKTFFFFTPKIPLQIDYWQYTGNLHIMKIYSD